MDGGSAGVAGAFTGLTGDDSTMGGDVRPPWMAGVQVLQEHSPA